MLYFVGREDFDLCCYLLVRSANHKLFCVNMLFWLVDKCTRFIVCSAIVVNSGIVLMIEYGSKSSTSVFASSNIDADGCSKTSMKDRSIVFIVYLFSSGSIDLCDSTDISRTHFPFVCRRLMSCMSACIHVPYFNFNGAVISRDVGFLNGHGDNGGS